MKWIFRILVVLVILTLSVKTVENQKKVNRLEKAQRVFQDSIIMVYKDSMQTLKNETESYRCEVYTSDLNADNAWDMYENLQSICDSIRKSKVKYMNVNPILRQKLPKDKEKYKMEIYFTKEEYEYLNRFSE